MKPALLGRQQRDIADGVVGRPGLLPGRIRRTAAHPQPRVVPGGRNTMPLGPGDLAEARHRRRRLRRRGGAPQVELQEMMRVRPLSENTELRDAHRALGPNS